MCQYRTIKDSVCCRHFHLWTSSLLRWRTQCLSKWSVGVRRELLKRRKEVLMFGGPLRDTVASARSLTPQCVFKPPSPAVPTNPTLRPPHTQHMAG